jgi:hypothetical protein
MQTTVWAQLDSHLESSGTEHTEIFPSGAHPQDTQSTKILRATEKLWPQDGVKLDSS